MKTRESDSINRDELGRPIADAGYPISGMASVSEVATVSGLCIGQIYKMIHAGELDSQRFGRAVRVPWASVRDAGMI